MNLHISIGGEALSPAISEALDELKTRAPEIGIAVFPGSEDLKYVWPTPTATVIDGEKKTHEFGEEAVAKLIEELGNDHIG